MSPLLSIEGLRHHYRGRRVLSMDKFTIDEGEVTAVVGPNGAGKSTLLRIINLLEKPTQGEVTYWDGSSLSRLDRAKRRELARQMAMIFQDPLLFRRSVRENVAYGLRVRRMGREEREARVEAILERLALAELAERDAATLSGGEARKTALGRALVLRPRLLLLDEPLSNIDLAGRRELLRLFAELVREEGITALYVSHDHHEVLEIADRLAVLLDGSLLQVGTPGEVFTRPACAEVAAFLGAENLLEGRVVDVRDGAAEIEVEGEGRRAGGRLSAMCDFPLASRVKVMVHPEEIVLLAGEEGAGSARNRLRARVSEVKEAGPMVRVSLQCGFPLVAHITKASREELGVEPGKELTAAIKATSLHVMPFTRESGPSDIE